MTPIFTGRCPMRYFFRCFVMTALSAWLVPSATAATPAATEQAPPTATPIKYVVVIFDENISFDH